MEESLLHFIWRYQPFTLNGLKTDKGEPVEIIDPGLYNTDSGPDFSNAKIRIGNTLWAGNVEMHIKSSDWFTHNHHCNKAYDNVILHVVVEADKTATNTRGTPLPTLVIPYPKELAQRYEELLESQGWIACATKIKEIDPWLIRSTIDRMLSDRLEAKTLRVMELVALAGGSWEEAFYRDLSRSLGLKSNAQPFQLLAQSIPLKALSRHKDNLIQIEAMLFGQSGLLATAKTDNYVFDLRKEYQILKSKFQLTPLESSLWKFMRLRPAAFPTIRIAQLAMLIHKSSGLFALLMEAESINQITELLRVSTSDYWKNHYVFGEPAHTLEKRLGQDTIRIITINCIAPFLFSYGRYKGIPTLEQKALKLLQQLPSERNSITKGFDSLGVHPTNAFDSQGIIHLKTQYCDTKKCIYCPIGVKILRKHE